MSYKDYYNRIIDVYYFEGLTNAVSLAIDYWTSRSISSIQLQRIVNELKFLEDNNRSKLS